MGDGIVRMKRTPLDVRPCGVAPGVFARTDAQRAVWKVLNPERARDFYEANEEATQIRELIDLLKLDASATS